MKFVSTRGKAPAVTFSEAARNGLAPDGGLYVPQTFPVFRAGDFEGWENDPYPVLAARILAPFFWGDPLEEKVEELCARAFNFPVPLEYLPEDTAVLELFHGPTGAFKDFGARFLAEALTTVNQGKQLILTATSGDTGSAVASAFEGRRDYRVGVLFPRDGVSARQRHLLTCWGENVRSFAVEGGFDDCQRMVKEAFADEAFRSAQGLTSANSINIGRLLPQVVYYAAASLKYLKNRHHKPSFVIPTGNLGNALACFWAKAMGFPVSVIGMSTNANRALTDYLETGDWKPQPAVRTIANAMDVGDPSNMERLTRLVPGAKRLGGLACTLSVPDEEIRETIAEGPVRWGRVWCPHTATAVRLRTVRPDPHWVIVSTADPAKFETVVEPVAGEVPLNPNLAELLRRETHEEALKPETRALIAALG